jgi:hypothetical protein
MPKSRMSRSYTPLPTSAFVACSGTVLALACHFITLLHERSPVKFASIFPRPTWRCRICFPRVLISHKPPPELFLEKPPAGFGSLRKQVFEKTVITYSFYIITGWGRAKFPGRSTLCLMFHSLEVFVINTVMLLVVINQTLARKMALKKLVFVGKYN